MPQTESSISAVSAPPLPGRLVSLDILRGLTIAGMLLVNNPGDWGKMWSPLGHAEWFGITPTDLIFPFFIFIMGTAIPFSFGKALEQGAGRAGLVRKIIQRSVILIALGLMLGLVGKFITLWYATPRDLSPKAFWETLRLPGVLQRLGVCYCFAALIALFFKSRGQIAWFAALTVGYWLFMRFGHAPGQSAGTLDKWVNLADWVDSQVFGIHNYQRESKESLRFHDPEGFLSSIPAIATCIAGSLTGNWLRRTDMSGWEKTCGLFVVGTVLVTLGRFWSLDFPIGKKLWTSSFVLYTAGWALLLLGCTIWLTDIKGRSRWARPLQAIGMNPILVFVGAGLMSNLSRIKIPAGADASGITIKTFVYDNLYKSWIPSVAGDKACSAAYGITFVALWTLIAMFLFRKKWFLKI